MTINTKNTIFILGPKSEEIDLIESLLIKYGFKFIYARCKRERINKHSLEMSSKIEEDISKYSEVIAVECFIEDSCFSPGQSVTVIDHHSIRSDNTQMSPNEYWEASSLFHVRNMLMGYAFTFNLPWDDTIPQHWKVVCAADHNLTAAYAGEIEGVSFEEVLSLRANILSNRRKYKRDPRDIENELLVLYNEVNNSAFYSKFHTFGMVVNLMGIHIGYKKELSHMLGLPVLFSTPNANYLKVVLVNAGVSILEKFLLVANRSGYKNNSISISRGVAATSIPLSSVKSLHLT